MPASRRIQGGQAPSLPPDPVVESGITLGELERRFQRIRGHRMAKATIENALIDLVARREGRPLHDLLGFPRRPIPSGISIGIQQTSAELIDAVAEAIAIGYHRVKMKIKRGCDVEMVSAVRKQFPGVPLMVDANGDYSIEDAGHLRQLDPYNLMMIEQPLSYSDIYGHSILQRSLSTPICLDESIHDLADARAAVALGSCRILNIKQGRVGGLMEALRIADFAASHNIPVWSGGMDETGIGRAVNIHLQTSPSFTVPGDTSETRLYFHEDIVDPAVVLDQHGFIAVPEGPGTGVRINDEILKKVTLQTDRLR